MTTSTTKSNVSKFLATTAFALVAATGAQDASATCTGSCSPPTGPVTIPSSPSNPTNNAGGAGGDAAAQAAAAAAAAANAQAAASLNSNIKVETKNDIKATGGAATATGGDAKATVEAGAVVASPTATATNGGIHIEAAKQATHITASNLVGGSTDCAATSSVSVGGSAVGVGAVTFAITTGTSMIAGCDKYQFKKEIVGGGIRSGNPALITGAFIVAGEEKAIDGITPERVKVFAMAPVGNAPSNNVTVVTPQFATAAQAAPQMTMPPCNVIGKKSGKPEAGEYTAHQLNGQTVLVCGPKKDALAPQ